MPTAGEALLQEGVVEAGVVGHHDQTLQGRRDLWQHLSPARLAGHQPIVDAGQAGDEGRNRHARVDQGVEGLDDSVAVHQDDGDLGDAVVDRAGAGRFDVDDGEPPGQQGWASHSPGPPSVRIRRPGPQAWGESLAGAGTRSERPFQP